MTENKVSKAQDVIGLDRPPVFITGYNVGAGKGIVLLRMFFQVPDTKVIVTGYYAIPTELAKDLSNKLQTLAEASAKQ